MQPGCNQLPLAAGTKLPGVTQDWTSMLWWVLTGITSLILLMFLWCAGSFLYLKRRYHSFSGPEQHFSDLQEEQRSPQSDS